MKVSSFLSETESLYLLITYFLLRRYKIISKLGSGYFWNHYLATNKFSNEKVALKQMEKSNGNLLNDGEKKDEIEILKKLEHSDI